MNISIERGFQGECVYLPAPVDVAAASTRSEDAPEREFVGKVVGKQTHKELEAVVGSAGLVVAGDEGSPRDKISARHLIEKAVCSFDAATLCIHVYEMVRHEEIGLVGGGEHVGVEGSALPEGTMAGA